MVLQFKLTQQYTYANCVSFVAEVHGFEPSISCSALSRWLSWIQMLFE